MQKHFFHTLIIIVFSANLLFAQSLDSLITLGNSYYTKFETEKAHKVFQDANKRYPKDWKVLSWLSRINTDIAEHMPSSNDQESEKQLATFEKAAAYADSAVQLAPDQALPYIRRAAANGKIALFKGVFSVGGVVNKVRDDAEKAIKLGNGGNETQGIAHFILARTHDKISDKWAPARSVLGLGWANYDSAIVHYKKAVNLFPNFMMIYVEYAKARMEKDKWKEAKELLEKAINTPIKDEDDKELLVEAKELLKEVNSELD